MFRTQENQQSSKLFCATIGIICFGLLYYLYSYRLYTIPSFNGSSKFLQLDKVDQPLFNDASVTQNSTEMTYQDQSLSEIIESDEDSTEIIETDRKSSETMNQDVSSEIPSNDVKLEIKYILQWTQGSASPFDLMGQGQERFKYFKCKYDNCFVTDKKDYLPDSTDFDAVAFSGKNLPSAKDLPQKRSEKQKFIFAAAESAHNYRVCNRVYDGYFNWTWTYKLDSDIRWAYITIYDLDGRVVGPKRNMQWPQLDPISEELKTSLSNKKKMAAWFVSHCSTLSKREQFVRNLQHEASSKGYDWTVDVFGPCGSHQCPRSRESDCFNIIKEDYYFYFSFENSFAEDYVTEKLLNALNNNAVPVVFGSADYSRFLPPGSYLDARELGVTKLAEAMDAIHKNHTAYYDFFRWQNHFKYKHTIESDICNLCAALNDEEAVKRTTVYQDFRLWWNDEQWNRNDKKCPL